MHEQPTFPIQRATQAVSGTWALASGPTVVGTRDAAQSLLLVGTTTRMPAGTFEEPVDRAAAWLAGAGARGAHSAELVELAGRTLELARLHARHLDLLAGQLAQDASGGGTVDAVRLERIDGMLDALTTWSVRLRDLFEQDGDAVGTLTAALDGAGDLEQLVARL
jgi:hypothetical protein